MPTIAPAYRDDSVDLLLDYLDNYRQTIAAALHALGAEDLRASRLPTGWTPLGLLVHLCYMERRSIHWGFAARDMAKPWGDGHGDRWEVPEDATVDALLAHFDAVGAETRRIVTGHELADHAAVGGRFTTADGAPSLVAILLHVLQEYARHAGQLDVVVELATEGRVVES